MKKRDREVAVEQPVSSVNGVKKNIWYENSFTALANNCSVVSRLIVYFTMPSTHLVSSSAEYDSLDLFILKCHGSGNFELSHCFGIETVNIAGAGFLSA
jgi:hypothetical protein